MLDGDCAASLTITRSLGRAGWDVVVGVPEGTRPLASRSRYASASFTYADPCCAAPAFQEQVTGVVAQHRPDLLVPVTDWTIVPLTHVRDALEIRRVVDHAHAFRFCLFERLKSGHLGVGHRVAGHVEVGEAGNLLGDQLWLMGPSDVVPEYRAHGWQLAVVQQLDHGRVVPVV